MGEKQLMQKVNIQKQSSKDILNSVKLRIIKFIILIFLIAKCKDKRNTNETKRKKKET